MGSTVYYHDEKWIKHYSSRHQILLVGEGDFSFAACLARAFGNASNMIATSRHSQGTLREKHPTAAENLILLKDKGCTIMHEIDACSMSQHYFLRCKKFDRIVFNFPHAGFDLPDRNSSQIALHQELVRGFLRNACEMVTEKGQIHVTHKTTYPFNMWGIANLGVEVGLRLSDKEDFDVSDYPGYSNKKGDGHSSNESFFVGECKTYKFSK